MNVIVTGASGFVGSHLLPLLNEKNINVITYSRQEGKDIMHWPDALINVPNEVDAIVHLAGKTFVPDSYKIPREFYHTNTISTLNALEIAREKKAKFIYISSYVYGVPAYLPVDEAHPINDFNPYAASKLMGEELCRSYHKHFGVECIILRPFNLYGPGQPALLVMQEILNQISYGTVILRDSAPKRDYLYITDLCAAIYKAILLQPYIGIDTVNIAYGKSYSLQEVTDLFGRHFPQVRFTFTEEKRPNEVPDTKGDITKAKELLGWQPEVSLDEGIAKLVQSINARI